MASPLALTTHLARTIRLALPAAVAHVGLILMGVVDTAMMGRIDAAALAGVGLGNSLYFVPTVLCMGIIMALDPLVSQAHGARRPRDCGAIYLQGMRMALWLSVPLVLVMLGSAMALAPLGIPPDVAAAAQSYLYLTAPSAPLVLGFVAQRSFVQGLGRTRPVMIAVAVGNVGNLLFNWLLIYGEFGFPRLELAGCAISTVLARALVLAMLAWTIHGGGRYRSHGVPGTPFGVDWPRLRAMMRLGLPVGAQMFVEHGMFGAVAFLMGLMGANSMASHQIALQMAALTFVVALGIGMAGGIRVGHAVGAGELHDARRAAWAAMASAMVVMSVGAALFFLLPQQLMRLFTDQPEIILEGAVLVRIAAFFQLADGAQVVAVSCLRGAGDTAWPLRVHLVASICVGLPLGIALAFVADLGAPGLWWGLTAGLLFSAVGLLWRLRGDGWMQVAARTRRLVTSLGQGG